MAEGKKGFILYADQKELFDQLSDQKAGILIKHIFKYVNDENPINKDTIINLAFTPIKQQLK
jgi:spermidine synthase